MEILVTHLTRMKEQCICVAGIDLATGKHVRPVLERRQAGFISACDERRTAGHRKRG